MAYGVVPLLDVLKFAADDFWEASRMLTEWRINCHEGISTSKLRESLELLGKLEEHLRRLALPITVREFEKLQRLQNNKYEDASRLNEPADRKLAYKSLNEEFSHWIGHVSSVLHSELESRLVFAVEQDRAEFLSKDWLTDSQIYLAFPKAWSEFQNAGRCYAYGEPTSAIFHLMRVIDSGLKIVYESLGEPYDSRNWEGIAKRIESEIGKRYQDKSADWKLREPFYAEVLTDIRSIARAHRNPVLHDLDRKYTDADAKYLIEVTKAFMSHLAANGMEEPS